MTIGLESKDLEHKILLENGDSIISGSGTNNQITTFTILRVHKKWSRFISKLNI